MIAVVAMLALAQLPPGFESRQNGRRLSNIQQGTIDCRPPLLCTVTDTTLRIYQGAASDLSCVGCVSDAEIVGVSGSKVTGAVPTATALATNPTDCTAGQYAKSIDAQGNLTCEAPAAGSTPSVSCAADEALNWNGSAWSCISKVRAAYMADAGLTAAALEANPTDCGANQYATAIAANGNLTCAQVTGGQVSGAVGTATALAADPADCTAGQYATTIAASGALTCSQVAYSQLTGAPTIPTDISGEGYWVKTASGNLSNEVAMGSLGTGLVLNTTTTGIPTIYGGTSCTNQFARSINGSGVATCAAVALGSDVTGSLPIDKGGTTETASTEDAVLVGAGATDWAPAVLPGCSGATTDKLLYNSTTNAFSCGTDQGGAGGGISFAEAAAANLAGAF